LQKQHTKAFQDLVDETNIRLKKVESEYNDQQNMTDKVISELENRIQLLKNEMDKNTQIIKNLELELKNKNNQINMLDSKVKETKSKNVFLENENQILKENHSKELSQLESMFNSKNQDYENIIQNLKKNLYDIDKFKTNLEKKNEKLNYMLK
jgi:chromosome segregation ATPase